VRENALRQSFSDEIRECCLPTSGRSLVILAPVMALKPAEGIGHHQRELFYMSAKKMAKKKTKPTPKKETKPTPRKTKPTQALGLAISEEKMMRMQVVKLEALGLSSEQWKRLRGRITNIQEHLPDMKNPRVYAKQRHVPLGDLKAFLVIPAPPMNDFKVKGE
jgi:hypothetical protein